VRQRAKQQGPPVGRHGAGRVVAFVVEFEPGHRGFTLQLCFSNTTYSSSAYTGKGKKRMLSDPDQAVDDLKIHWQSLQDVDKAAYRGFCYAATPRGKSFRRTKATGFS
jgi:hypothetical protein